MMTLTQVLHGMTEDTTDFMEKSPEEAMCDVVRSAITDAARSGRLTHGISECVTVLQRDPKEVVICILPMDTSGCDVNLNIELLLIESVCVEFDILVLKMDISQLDSGLAFTGSKTELRMDNDSLDSPTTKQPVKSSLLKACPELALDLFCCIIKHGEEGPSFSDRKLLDTFQGLSEKEDYHTYSTSNNNKNYNNKKSSSSSNSNNNTISSNKRFHSSSSSSSSSCSLSEDSCEDLPPE
ncbi:growth arrest and DNA damage-inducible protein gadd45 gamma-like [Plakobranchus ocellatus]|uniref:Growth arrest and DNA damage-inducible protein gadd45 gamma-like n=1 Tax=Plakobranchus ocellatus TaxID=259542 RepID=A0AAV4AI29_9GAST|nr:growth arrest and DNA damage-inducible protein gadd45 gamma-like [Plakobranchus ocellatus]